MEIDWQGIARSSKLVSGDQGDANLLLLKADNPVTNELLDELIPDAEEDGRANGGWFAVPQGWALFIEGLSADVKVWIERLGVDLQLAGISGLLTGAKTASRPIWGRPIEALPQWRAGITYRLAAEPYSTRGWGGDPQVLTPVIGHSIGWLCRHGAAPRVSIDLRAPFLMDQPAAREVLSDEARRSYGASASSYHKERREIRTVHVAHPATTTHSVQTDAISWTETIQDLRTLLMAVPTDQIAFAMVSHLALSDYLNTGHPSVCVDSRAFRWYPNRWDEFVVDAFGIQILTDRHLAKAHSLTGWNTTRLDEHHYLVEAEDLGPWYSKPRAWRESPDRQLLNEARDDFGEIILTPAQAHIHGLDQRPPGGSGSVQ